MPAQRRPHPHRLSSKATIVSFDAKGVMTTLRKGTNGWTCMPDAPDTPGPDPMCSRRQRGQMGRGVARHHKPPPAGAVGVMYMLEGGTDASNTDPYATKPTSSNDVDQHRSTCHDRWVQGRFSPDILQGNAGHFRALRHVGGNSVRASHGAC